MIEAWIVANQKDLVNAGEDRIFHRHEDAKAFQYFLDTVCPGPWKVYKIRVEFMDD